MNYYSEDKKLHHIIDPRTPGVAVRRRQRHSGGPHNGQGRYPFDRNFCGRGKREDSWQGDGRSKADMNHPEAARARVIRLSVPTTPSFLIDVESVPSRGAPSHRSGMR